MPRKRIAFVGVKGLPSKAGADRVVEALVTRLDRERFEPVVYCSAAVVPAGTQLPGVRLVRIHALPGKHLHATSLFLLAALHALFLGRYDLVHLHNVEASYVLPLLRLRFKVISTSHGPAQKREKWGAVARKLIQLMEWPYVRFSNAVTSVSLPLAEQYEDEYGRRVYFIPNGVDEAEAVDLDAAAALLDGIDVTPHNFVFFAAGRIMTSKGCHLLLEATRAIPGDFQVVVVGDASHMPSYETELHALADERVRFVPFINEKATLMGLLKLCQLFVFPSTVEAMSMMLLEAASMETPILCSDIPENVGVLPSQALHFRSGDAADLEARLRWALDHPSAMAELASQAHAWVNQNHQWDGIVDQYEALYDDLLAEGRLSMTSTEKTGN